MLPVATGVDSAGDNSAARDALAIAIVLTTLS